jgi:hypothetical protein
MVSVGMLGVLGVALAAMTGVAQASSIVVLGLPTSTPSIVRLGALEPANISASLTPSIVALGDPLPDVSNERVAAIPHQPASNRGFRTGPMIIRGGVVGGAFATPQPNAAPAEATAAAAPAADTKTGPKTAATNSPPEPAAPQPAPIPAVEKTK